MCQQRSWFSPLSFWKQAVFKQKNKHKEVGKCFVTRKQNQTTVVNSSHLCHLMSDFSSSRTQSMRTGDPPLSIMPAPCHPGASCSPACVTLTGLCLQLTACASSQTPCIPHRAGPQLAITYCTTPVSLWVHKNTRQAMSRSPWDRQQPAQHLEPTRQA